MRSRIRRARAASFVPIGPLDVVSALLSLATALPIIYGLKELVQHGAGSVKLAALTIGVAFGALFVRRQRDLAVPMLELNLFGNRTVVVVSGQSLIAGVEQQLNVRVGVEQCVDAFDAGDGDVVHGPGADRTTPRGRPVVVGGDGGLDVVLFKFAGDERFAAGAVFVGGGAHGSRWRPRAG
jgi:hypothetical protein